MSLAPHDSALSIAAHAHSILLVEDDLEIALNISRDLSRRGYSISHTATAQDGLAQARRGAFDLMIVDRMLDDIDGLTILETMRAEAMSKPVLVLSAMGGSEERVKGLRAGGDDYLIKPFDPEELVARIEALLRRSSSARETSLQVGPLKLDLIERSAWRDQREIDLLPREFKLLEYLMRHRDQVVTRAMLLEDIWQYKFVPETNLVDVHIGKLRRKIDGPGEPPMVLSVRRAGFMLSAPA
ncbi:MAG TPA: response regulator transcription factor [Magnetospirillaceae bacterium]|jgi:two-component system OmpR family response regulator